ncbi:molybdopterin molybdotransferase MoeA [Rhodoplanes sp. Z2-YC6860]|uniref:molybdopterin molybdotransferase MoeA n=1 Tax=Rhodoplanes sp. Z2-YC6860 TaxID=674703 RepID=UPI00078C5BD4|nr:gephyrin-like molybdotransferase Glp [Rhodoplanes sp. Z2-YC6860]AMN42356.1 molybdopterin biosynthesis protein MoeA [Rhodoplanes sp. Z2-YC6860]
MASLLLVADALKRVLDGVEPLPAENAPLVEAEGRVLAADVAALRTQPPADMSAMDGYAVKAADVAKVPVDLKLVGEVAAGRPFSGEVHAGEAARIFTGGVVPPGADTIVIQENTKRDGDRITVDTPSPAGRHIRRAGLDFKDGQVLLPRGRRLSDRDVMLAAAMSHPTLPVHRRPKVAVLATGDELKPPGSKLGAGEIVYSNGFALMALARNEGATVTDIGIVPDKVEATVEAIRRARASGADVLLTTGGASVGDYDLVQRGLKAEGLDLSFWRVALRPGRPMMNGKLGSMHVLGMPGNPVSAYVCSFLFLVPLLRRLAGRSDLSAAPESAKLGVALPENDERADYMRATLVPGPDGVPVVTPAKTQDSSMMAVLANADCLLIREPFEPAAPAGSRCSILRLTRPF